MFLGKRVFVRGGGLKKIFVRAGSSIPSGCIIAFSGTVPFVGHIRGSKNVKITVIKDP
jgi:hypothetical protein